MTIRSYEINKIDGLGRKHKAHLPSPPPEVYKDPWQNAVYWAVVWGYEIARQMAEYRKMLENPQISIFERCRLRAVIVADLAQFEYRAKRVRSLLKRPQRVPQEALFAWSPHITGDAAYVSQALRDATQGLIGPSTDWVVVQAAHQALMRRFTGQRLTYIETWASITQL